MWLLAKICRRPRKRPTATSAWPPGFGADLEHRDITGYQNGFAFDKSLEQLALHPTTWPILMELTNYRSRFTSGTLGYNHHRHWFHPLDAGWTPDKRPDIRHYFIEGGTIRCTDFTFFFYLSDVFPGDGGLIVLPGSHKAEFERPPDMFYPDSYDNEGYLAEEVPPGVCNITPRASLARDAAVDCAGALYPDQGHSQRALRRSLAEKLFGRRVIRGALRPSERAAIFSTNARVGPRRSRRSTQGGL